MPQCTIKKVIRNNPVSPIVNFLPMEEVKSCFHVIKCKLGFLPRKNTPLLPNKHILSRYV